MAVEQWSDGGQTPYFNTFPPFILTFSCYECLTAHFAYLTQRTPNIRASESERVGALGGVKPPKLGGAARSAALGEAGGSDLPLRREQQRPQEARSPKAGEADEAAAKRGRGAGRGAAGRGAA